MPGRLKSTIRKRQISRILRGTVLEVLCNRMTVRLSRNGTVIHGVRYVGGPISVGREVEIDYSSGTPVAMSIGEKYIPEEKDETKERPIITEDDTRKDNPNVGDDAQTTDFLFTSDIDTASGWHKLHTTNHTTTVETLSSDTDGMSVGDTRVMATFYAGHGYLKAIELGSGKIMLPYTIRMEHASSGYAHATVYFNLYAVYAEDWSSPPPYGSGDWRLLNEQPDTWGVKVAECAGTDVAVNEAVLNIVEQSYIMETVRLVATLTIRKDVDGSTTTFYFDYDGTSGNKVRIPCYTEGNIAETPQLVLNDLLDVTIQNPQEYEVVMFDGSKWENRPQLIAHGVTLWHDGVSELYGYTISGLLSALASATDGDIVVISPGTLEITDAQAIPTGVLLIGYDATLSLSNVSSPALSLGENARIRGLKILGDAPDTLFSCSDGSEIDAVGVRIDINNANDIALFTMPADGATTQVLNSDFEITQNGDGEVAIVTMPHAGIIEFHDCRLCASGASSYIVGDNSGGGNI